ncbi:MAG: GNAT family N-acetyltransferase [Chloroflexota bacterium]
MNLHLEVAATPQAFRALAGEWDELLDSSPAANVFLTWEWLSTWWECFGRHLQPWVVVLRHGRHLVGLAPFILHRRARAGPFTHRELSFMGSGPAAPDHLDLIASPGCEAAVAQATFAHLSASKRQWDILRLEGLAENSPFAGCLLTQRRDRLTQVSHQVCPYAHLPADQESYRAGLGSNLRANIGRYGRQLEREHPGQVRYWLVEDEAQIEPAMRLLFRLHQEVRQAHGQPGAFSDPQMVLFHRHLAHRFFAKGWLRIYLLTVAGQDTAITYNFRFGDVVYFYQTGYDQAWKRYGPGRQVISFAIRQSIEEGAREFDFLRGDESYKFQWTNQIRRDINLVVPCSRLGQLILGGRTAARAARAHLRPPHQAGQPQHLSYKAR